MKPRAGGPGVDQRLMGIAEAIRRHLDETTSFRGGVYRYLCKAPHLTFEEMLERAERFQRSARIS